MKRCIIYPWNREQKWMIEKCENKVPFESVSCLYRRQEGDVFYLFQCRCQEKEVNIKDNVVNLESMR